MRVKGGFHGGADKGNLTGSQQTQRCQQQEVRLEQVRKGKEARHSRFFRISAQAERTWVMWLGAALVLATPTGKERRRLLQEDVWTGVEDERASRVVALRQEGAWSPSAP